MKTGRADAAAHRPRHGKKARTVMQNIYRFADHTIEIESLYPLVHELCAAYQTEESGAEYSVRITEEDILSERASLEAAWRQSGYDPRRFSARYLETLAVYRKIAEALLPCDILLMHGSVVAVDGRAYLFTAKSGTGKTTHYLHWKALWDREVEILCGDKPILAFDGPEITVHPSPWNGKEAMGQLRSGPLGGIVVLRQSGTDRIRRLSRREAVWPLFPQFLFRRATVAQVQAVGRMEEQLLGQVPVWLLENRVGGASALLCRNALLEV